MNSQQYAIAAATEFLSTYIVNSRGLNAQFKTVVNKRDMKDLDEDVFSGKSESKATEIPQIFWKEIRWSLTQATLERFLKFFNEQEGDMDIARSALKSVAIIGFDLNSSSSLSDYISSTPDFLEYKSKSLKATQRQLVDVEQKFKTMKESGQAVNSTDQKNHDIQVGRFKEIIERGGQPVLTPPQFIKCYMAVLDDVVVRACDVIQWSSPNPKPAIEKKIDNANH